MEQNEILQGNKLIADFMGIETKVYTDRPSMIYYSYNGFMNTIDQMKYHLSWDWLMPIIEKISKVPVIGATEQSDTCYPRTFGMLQDDTGLPMFRFNCCHLYVGATLIEAAWIAVVEFIKMENNFKNNNL